MIVVVALLGLVAGGFVTMLVDRIPDATPLTLHSRCPHCQHDLGWSEVVPVVSWVVQQGRCRHCDDRVTIAYPVVEVVTAGLLAVTVAVIGTGWVVVPTLVFVVAGVALAVIDLYVYRLPDRLLFPSLALSIVTVVVAGVALDEPAAVGRALVGMIGYSVVFFVLHLAWPRGLGFGDVKLALLMGLHLGWVAGVLEPGWRPVVQLVLYAILLGNIVGVVGGLLVAILRRRDRDVLVDPEAEDGQPERLTANTFPFGPALLAGAFVVVLAAESLLTS